MYDEEKRSDPEPPPIIKQIIWLQNFQNWKKHWKAILIALLLVAATPFVPNIIDQAVESDGSDSDKQQEVFLPEDQVRNAIRTALHDDDVDYASSLLSKLSNHESRRQECEHIFDFCIKNGKLSDGLNVVDLCWEGSTRNEKLSQIEHEQLKVQPKRAEHE